MGLFKNIFDNAADAMKEALEQKKAEFQENLNQRKEELQGRMGLKKTETHRPLASNRTGRSSSSSSSSSSEINTDFGVIKNGVLEIKEGITELKEGSLSKYKSLKKVIFPASLTKLESYVFNENTQLEELDFSKVTKLEYIPDVFVYEKNKIKELKIPYGVKHVGGAVVCDIDRTHPLVVYVPATVRKFDGFATNNAVTFYLFSPDVDIEWLIDDAKEFWVLEKDYDNYKHQMDEYGGDVTIGVIKPHAQFMYSDLIDGPDDEEEEEVVETKKQDNPTKDSNNIKKKSTDEDTIKFSPRVEALIKSAFRDGVITKKEKEIIIKRAVAEGEDADEFEMLLDSRIADEGIKEE